MLVIPGDDEIDLDMQQLDDFRPGKPGSEEARHLLEYHGLFLLDGDRSWDEQAVNAIEKSIKEKKAQFDAFVGRIKDSRIAAGSPVDDNTLDQLIKTHNYDELKRKIEVLQKRLEVIRGVLSEKGTKGKVKTTLDPKRTCFITQPPREFPSETALKLFLMEQSPEFVAKHEDYLKQLFEEDE